MSRGLTFFDWKRRGIFNNDGMGEIFTNSCKSLVDWSGGVA